MTPKQLFGFIAAFIIAISLLNSFFVVDERQRVIKKQFGEIVGVDYAPGIHFKIPFAQNISVMDGRILALDNQSEDFLTSEKKNVKVDYFVKWRIADVQKYYRATSGLEMTANDRLSSILNRALRDQFGVRTIKQAVSDERDEITRAVENSVAGAVAEFGIELVDVRVKAIDLPDQVSDSVYGRMRAERQRVASDFLKFCAPMPTVKHR